MAPAVSSLGTPAPMSSGLKAAWAAGAGIGGYLGYRHDASAGWVIGGAALGLVAIISATMVAGGILGGVR